MNFDNLIVWVTGIVIAFAAAGRLETLQTWIWTAQARVLVASRTSTWGSPKFFSSEKAPARLNHQIQVCNDLNVNHRLMGRPSIDLTKGGVLCKKQ
jgi:hypothetical protein